MKNCRQYSVLIILTMLSSCRRTPVANFTCDKSQYTIGDVIHLTNTSSNSDSYKWTGTGITGEITTRDLDLVTKSTEIYNITLTVYSKGKKRSSKKAQGISVIKPSGKITFFTLNASNLNIEISDGNKYLGSIYQNLISVPVCGEYIYGGLTVLLDPGPHQYLFIKAGNYVYVNDTVQLNTCKLFQIN